MLIPLFPPARLLTKHPTRRVTAAEFSPLPPLCSHNPFQLGGLTERKQEILPVLNLNPATLSLP